MQQILFFSANRVLLNLEKMPCSPARNGVFESSLLRRFTVSHFSQSGACERQRWTASARIPQFPKNSGGARERVPSPGAAPQGTAPEKEPLRRMLRWPLDVVESADSSTEMKRKPRAAGDTPQQGTSGRFHDEQPPETSSAMLPIAEPIAASEGLWYAAEPDFGYQLQLGPARSSVMETSATDRGFVCPICLRTEELPIRQECGHMLCLHCIQQGFVAVGGCPLCQTQQLFSARARNMQSIATTSAMMDVPYSGAMGPQPQYAFGAFPEAFVAQSAPIDVDGVVPVSLGLDPSRAHSVHLPSESSDLHLEALSDFSDMIDLADLVASDSDTQRPPTSSQRPTAARSESTTPPMRVSRTTQRKVAGSKAHASAGPQTSRKTVVRSSSPAAIANKRRRKSSEPIASTVSMIWEEVEVSGPKPAQRYDCGFAAYGNRLIVVGGIVGKLRSNDLHFTDISSSCNWVHPALSGSPPPTGSLLQAFVVQHTLYVIGGTKDGKFISEVYAVDLGTLSSWFSPILLVSVGRLTLIRMSTNRF